MILTPEGHGLTWQSWDGIYIVYQASSTETHVLNETTAGVLRCLTEGHSTLDQISEWIVQSLEINLNELDSGDLFKALERLVELGLVDWSDETAYFL
ncbi:MAG: HPr-rel-A system PqqD family peptide chaperone [Proteobacteria bacterium]|nr:HPr-rel-A system PqqD family peptide chaperone [Pseudomonadota bacterium]